MDDLNLKESDKFFHCVANYEAASRGGEGYLKAIDLSDLRELYGKHIKGESAKERAIDQYANSLGRIGFLEGKTLKEACPTHPNDYLNYEDDYIYKYYLNLYK